MSDEVVVIVAGGEAPHPDVVLAVPPGAPIIAADDGLEHALALGLELTLAVGDFDSASPASVSAASAACVRIERHPAEKDATDLELALAAALALQPARILVLAGVGSRLDHLFAALLLLGSARYSGVELDAHIGRSRAHVVRRERVLTGERGELISLFALHGPAEGVRTEGLRYPLSNETLEPGSSRGMSNVFAEETARIRVERGVILAIRPGDAEDDAE